MRAVIVEQPGGPENLVVADVPDPRPGPGEVLIEVASAGVNRADLLQRQGHYPPPPGTTDVLGLECAGTVGELGEDVTGLEVGAEVCALLSGGGYAERVVVPAGQVVPVPSGVPLDAAGGIPETFATVWSNVFMSAELAAGETLLVHGGSSGIGTTAIQLAKAFGATVVTTVGTAEKAQIVRDLGADGVVNYHEEDFVDACREVGGADVILDIIGAKYLPRNVTALARHGRLVVIGMQGGMKGELNLGALLSKQGTITAASLRSRPTREKSEIMAELVEHVWPLVAEGTVGPIVHEIVPLERVADAHRILEDSTHVGKVILDVRS